MPSADTALSILLAGAIWIGLALRGQAGSHRVGRANAAVAALLATVAIPTLTQLLLLPRLEGWLERNERKFVHHGQIWRLATALLVQDRGWGGAVFNLAGLALLGFAAARLLPARTLLLGFGLGALGGEVAGLWWQPRGAGNSVGNCGIAASILACGLLRGPRPLRIAAVAVSLVGLTLPFARDIHGAAFATALAGMLVVQARSEAEGV